MARKGKPADVEPDTRRLFEARRRKSAEQDVRLFLRSFYPMRRLDAKAVVGLGALLMQYYVHGGVDALWHWLDVGGEAKRQALINGRRPDFDNG